MQLRNYIMITLLLLYSCGEDVDLISLEDQYCEPDVDVNVSSWPADENYEYFTIYKINPKLRIYKSNVTGKCVWFHLAK